MELANDEQSCPRVANVGDREFGREGHSFKICLLEEIER